MKKLGKKMSELYDHPTSKDPTIYPSAHLPADMFEGAYKVGDECHIHLKGKIESMSKEGYHVKFHEGKEAGTIGPISKDKQKSLIASAKVNT